jgi:DNA-binding MarR family transcriptional regulator
MSQPYRQAPKPAPKNQPKEPYYAVDSFEPMRSVGFLIKRCGSLMALIAESKFESQPISFTQWLVLMKLRFHSQMSATQLSKEIGHDMGALTRLVDSLERSGFVCRERSRQDRRAVEITLTTAGRLQVEGSIQLIVDMLNELVEPFSKNELDTLIAQLQRMLGLLQDYVDAEPDPRPAAERPVTDFLKPAKTPRGRNEGSKK